MELKIICRLCHWEGKRKQLVSNGDDFLVCPVCDHPEFRPKEKIKFEPDDDFEGGFRP